MLAKVDELNGKIGKEGKGYKLIGKNCKHSVKDVLEHGEIKTPDNFFPNNWFDNLKGMKHNRNVDLQNEIQGVLNSTNEKAKK